MWYNETRKENENGFAAAYMLAAIGTIALLATLGFVYLGNQQLKERDSKRIEDLKLIHAGLQRFYEDNQALPQTPADNLGDSGAACLGSDGWEQLGCGGKAEKKVYLSKVPQDPLNRDEYVYKYKFTGTTFSVVARLEGSFNGYDEEITLSPSGISD